MVLFCIVCCVRIADNSGLKVSTTRSIQTGPYLIAEEGYALTTRVITGIGLLCPLRMQFLVTYGDPTLIPTRTSNLVR